MVGASLSIDIGASTEQQLNDLPVALCQCNLESVTILPSLRIYVGAPAEQQLGGLGAGRTTRSREFWRDDTTCHSFAKANLRIHKYG